MSASPRDYLIEELEPLLPSAWKFVPNQRNLDEIDRPTVMLRHTKIERLAEAPSGHLRHTVSLLILSPHDDPIKAENSLDVAVTELITDIDSLPLINWTSAEKAKVDDRWLGWDITLTVISTKDPS